MAYFIRQVTAGGRKDDPRSWTYAVYKCDVCGEESEYTVTPNFQYRERPCKHCKSMGVNDYLQNLKRKKEIIYNEITKLNKDLLKIEIEIEEFKHNIKVKEEIEILTKEN